LLTKQLKIIQLNMIKHGFFQKYSKLLPNLSHEINQFCSSHTLQ
jgi:hypothetical protein